MKLYLAGPMSYHPQFNFPLFDEAAHQLRARGYEVVSPAELDDPETRRLALESADGVPGGARGDHNGFTWGDFLARDVKVIGDEVDGVTVMPEWWTSRGARLEAYCCWLSAKPVFSLMDILNGLEPYSLDVDSILCGASGHCPHPHPAYSLAHLRAKVGLADELPTVGALP